MSVAEFTDRAPYPPLLVTDHKSFSILLKELSGAPAVGVDTESNSLYAYKERVCLIQFSIPGRDFILDPFCFKDLKDLAAFFSNPEQQKIFHAAEYDILCLKRDYGFEFAGLFDTMVAARTLGWPRTGLDSLLEERLGVKINKKHQRANWGMRPLPQGLIDYAQLDTHYLIELRDLQTKELLASDRSEEAMEEFERVARIISEPIVSDADEFWRVKGSYTLGPQQAAILRELYDYREKQARHTNRPRFKVMGDPILLAIAISQPKSLHELKQIPGMTDGQVHRYGHALLNAVQRGLTAAHPRRPRHKRLPTEVRDRFERLQQWRKEKGKDRGVEPGVILPREALWALAHQAPQSANDLDAFPHIGARRRKLYGDELIELLNPKRNEGK
jgi:ribonuclease D